VVDTWLPFRNELLAQQEFHDRELAYSPDGTVFPALRASGTSFVGFAIMMGLLVWWIRWNTRHIFLAEQKGGDAQSQNDAQATIESRWWQLTREQRMVLLQVARDRIANPRQRQTVTTLLEQRLLRMAPDLRPYSKEVEKVLEDKRKTLTAELRAWEELKVAHSWRNVRLILIVSVSALALFLFATQPGLQSNLAGIASGVTALLSAMVKLREAVASWLPGRRNAA
jgi:hypothetical protein